MATSQGHLLITNERCCIDLLDERVVVAAHSTTHLVLSIWGAVIVALLHYEVDRGSSMQVLGQVPEVVQHKRVLINMSTEQSGHSLQNTPENSKVSRKVEEFIMIGVIRLTSGMDSCWSSPMSTLSVTAMLNESIPTNTATLKIWGIPYWRNKSFQYKNKPL